MIKDLKEIHERLKKIEEDFKSIVDDLIEYEQNLDKNLEVG